jgi:hypothetical protein
MSSARFVLGACVLVAGCAGASWTQVQVSPAYQPPKAVTVTVLVQATKAHSAEAGQALQTALGEGLEGAGIKATFVPAAEGATQGDVTVAEWDQGSRALRWIGFGMGEGSIVVVVKTPSADGQAGLQGTARGWVKGGAFGGDSYESAVEAGHLIAKAIATGKAKVD